MEVDVSKDERGAEPFREAPPSPQMQATGGTDLAASAAAPAVRAPDEGRVAGEDGAALEDIDDALLKLFGAC